MLLMLVAYGLGQTIGPLTLKPLESVNFMIGSVHIIYGNVACLILLAMNTIRIVLLGFLTHDLSNEHDLKAHQEKTKREGAVSISSNTSWGSILKNSFSFDVIFLLSHTVYSGVLGAFIGRTFPLVVDTLHYDNFALDMCFIGESVCMTIISILIGVAKPHSLGVYVCGVVSLIAFVIAQLCLFLLPRGMSEGFNVFLLVALVLSYAVNWITDQTFSIVTLGKLVPSEVKTDLGKREKFDGTYTFTGMGIFFYFSILWPLHIYRVFGCEGSRAPSPLNIFARVFAQFVFKNPFTSYSRYSRRSKVFGWCCTLVVHSVHRWVQLISTSPSTMFSM